MTRVSIRDAVIAGVSYADIFEYPLTPGELVLWLPFFANPKTLHLTEQGDAIKSVQIGNVTYYGLRRVKQLVTIRRKREGGSKKKMLMAHTVAHWFRIVPTIRLVGVTGGLAMGNAKKEDDIDLLFVTKNGTLWISRLLVTLITELLGIRRRPGDTNVRDKACLNMFVAEDGLIVPKHERDMFSAHEVLQMVPLWERGGAYQQFLRANQWVKEFLPNAWEKKMKNEKLKMKNETQRKYFTFYILHFTLRLLEPLAKATQLWYMRKRRTNEVISGSVIRFHPTDARAWVRGAFAKGLARYNIPLVKIFYGS